MKWLLNKWDWWVYRRAYKSFQRLAQSNQGFTYLFELHLREYNKQHEIPESLKRSTELFYNAMKSAKAKKEAAQ